MDKPNTINGIEVNTLFEMINAVKKNPELAKFQFRAKNTWMNGGHSRSVIKGFYGGEREDDSRSFPFIFEIDQPPALLGSNKGPTPVEYVLNALAGCLTSSIIYYATSKGIIIDEIESELEGNFDLQNIFGLQGEDEDPFDNINVRINIKGNNLTEKDKEFLCGLGKRTSPVYKIITHSFPVKMSVDNDFYSD
jgi:uncharacterized OsmC-like protein